MQLKIFFRFIILFCTCMQLAMCSQSHKKDKKIFHYNEVTGIASLDPAFAKNQSVMWAIHQLYNTLVETDDNLNFVPSLAKSWEVSTDRKQYIFHLRTDVVFHDDNAFTNGKGRRLTANDVVYSFNRIIDKGTASSGAWIFNNRIDSINAFTAINDSTFQLSLLRPFNPVLGLLSMQYCSIVPKVLLEQ